MGIEDDGALQLKLYVYLLLFSRHSPSFLLHLLFLIYSLDQTGRRSRYHATTCTFRGPPSATSCHSRMTKTYVTTYRLARPCSGSGPISNGMTLLMVLDLTGIVQVVSQQEGERGRRGSNHA